MSKYAENNLNRGEHIVLKAKVNWLAILPVSLWCLIMLVGVIYIFATAEGNMKEVAPYLFIGWAVIGLLPLIVKILNLLSISIAITDKRVIGKCGVLRIETLDYPIGKVDNVSLKAGPIANLLHYHTLTVLGGGGGDAKIVFHCIGNGTQFKNTVIQAIEKNQEEARKAQAEEIARAMGK